MKFQIPKSQIPNKSQIPKSQNLKTKPTPSNANLRSHTEVTARSAALWNLDFWDLEFIWDLGFWDLGFQIVTATPTNNMNKTSPRILFLGYSEVGYECLSLLLSRGDNVVALITHEDNPNEKIWFKTPASLISDFQTSAAAPLPKSEQSAIRNPHSAFPPFPPIPVFTPASINTPEWLARIRDEIRPDLILSVYYRNMVGARILEIPRLGAFNMHGSLLPKYRGRAPINWAVLHGEPRIGMTLHKMVRRADAGDIIDQQGVDIAPRDTAEQAFRKVLPCARAVLARQIDALLSGSARATPQDESQATYFGGRKPDDGRIDFAKTSAEIFNLIRAVTDPYPGAFVDVPVGNANLPIGMTAQNAASPESGKPANQEIGVPSSARLMIWWAEPDSPAVRETLLNDARARRDITPIIATAPPIPRKPASGEILSLAPLIVATADGALELTRVEWRGAPAKPLRIGQVL